MNKDSNIKAYGIENEHKEFQVPTIVAFK